MTVIYLARGHGIRPDGVYDPGAAGNGWTEQTAVDVVAPVVTADLERAGIRVIDEGENDPNFVGSIRAANHLDVDACIALHFDWSRGWDSHAYHHSTSVEGAKLAHAIVKALSRAGRPIKAPGAWDRDGLAIVSKTKMTGVLVELGRIGDPSNDEISELEAIGHAVAAGIANHYGVTIPPEAPPRVTRAVAVGAVARPDLEVAAMVAATHTFAFVRPLEDGRWLQTYPDGTTVVVDQVDYLVGIGGASQALVAQVGDGVAVFGATSYDTALRALELILDRDVPRRRPWAA